MFHPSVVVGTHPHNMVDTTPSLENKQNNTTLRFAIYEVWRLAWPTILTMTSFTVMQFTDRLMVGQIGKVEIAAQGNAGTWAFAAIATIMGIVTVVFNQETHIW